jgi:hypothetical protein
VAAIDAFYSGAVGWETGRQKAPHCRRGPGGLSIGASSDSKWILNKKSKNLLGFKIQ